MERLASECLRSKWLLEIVRKLFQLIVGVLDYGRCSRGVECGYWCDFVSVGYGQDGGVVK